MTRQERYSLVERFLECVNTRNLDGLDAVVAEDYRQRDPSLPQGRSGLKQGLSSFLDAFADLRAEADELFVDGPVVCGSFRWRGTHVAPFAGYPPTNRSVEFVAAEFWVVRDGVFVEHWGITDLSPLAVSRREVQP